MPVVLLVRHGQASFGAADYDALSDLGREQSRSRGVELGERGLRSPVLACGSLRRQRDTAALLADAAGWTSGGGPGPQVDARWDEYDHLALLERYGPPPEETTPSALTSHQVQGLLDVALLAWVSDPDGTWTSFRQDALTALQDLVGGLGSGQDAVVVTSGGVIAAVCAGMLELGAAGVVALNRVMVNGGATTLVAGGRGTSLLTINEHVRLGQEGLLSYR